MSIALQLLGLAILSAYVYAAFWVIRDALDPIPEFPHRRGFLGPVRTGAFFLGTGGLVAWGVGSVSKDTSALAGLIGLAAASGSAYLLMELKRRGLVEMEWQAKLESEKVLGVLQSLQEEEIERRAQELEAEVRDLRQKLPLSGEIGRQLSRKEWIALWRNEAVLAGLAKFTAREVKRSIVVDRPHSADH